jgi:hypothetical protein
MSTSDLQQLASEKGKVCISILLPTDRHTRERQQNPTIVLKAIQKAKALLDSIGTEGDIEFLRSKLDAIEKQIDYVRLQEGLGIFVSQNISKVFLFPISVKEKIIVETKFALHDLYYLHQFIQPYYLLAISKKRVPLYRGEGRHLQEIRNDDFPTYFKDEYEYAYPSLGSSTGPGLQNVEGDKSIIAEGRQITFIKQVDRTLEKYLKTSRPLIVAGVDEELANFSHTTLHAKNIIGLINGNYAIDALHLLSEIAWRKVNEHILKSHDAIVKKLEEDIGKKMAVGGVRDVWAMAKLGKALVIVVEKDYHSGGYVDPSNEVKLYLNPPIAKHQEIADAVEEIISTAIEKKGNIVVVENGKLEKFGRIAVLLRYP